MLWVLLRSTVVRHKPYVVGTHQKRLSEALPMSTHNICFNGELEKIIAVKYSSLATPDKPNHKDPILTSLMSSVVKVL